ncbi:putative amidohydrolase protein [Purpureocillium lavendulum]|uniref:Amidohydrolase protein n=1 Tax=Purpureocillium lavendulum TaxID=1247861 RepID=A0AB34FTX0_9HYPO|nr:putative amidohydrolase protein [Purpureocillium lavendulum]
MHLDGLFAMVALAARAVMSAMDPGDNPHAVYHSSMSQNKPHGDDYKSRVTGTLNGTTLIVPIPLSLATELVPWDYKILNGTWQALLPDFDPDMYPLMLTAVFDHDVGSKRFAFNTPSFHRAAFEFPFIDRLHDDYTSFRWTKHMMITSGHVAARGASVYGIRVIPSTFDPPYDAYSCQGGRKTSFSAQSVDNTSSLAIETWPAAGDNAIPYPIDFIRNITNQPTFGGNRNCDNYIQLFNTSLTTDPAFEPVPVVARVKANLAPMSAKEDRKPTTYDKVYGWRLSTAFVEPVFPGSSLLRDVQLRDDTSAALRTVLRLSSVPIILVMVGDGAMAPKQFKIDRKNFGGHYDVRSTTDEQLYFVDMWSFGSGKPDLTLHDGPDNKAPIVAVCHMPALSNSFKIGLGDPVRLDAMVWEDLAKERLTQAGWRWATELLDKGTRTDLVWKRTKSAAVEGMTVPSMSSRNFKLQEAQKTDVLAVFTSERTYRTCGVLQVNVEGGREFELMVLATCLTLYEEARREAQRSWSAGSKIQTPKYDRYLPVIDHGRAMPSHSLHHNSTLDGPTPNMTITSIVDVDVFDGAGIRRIVNQCFEGSPGNVIEPRTMADVTIDGTGCTLMPGLIDSKVDANASPAALPSFAANGVTTIIDLSSTSAENRAMRRESRNPKLPSYLGTGCVIGSEAAASGGAFPFRTVRGVRTPVDAKRLVEELVADPIRADYIKAIADQPGLDQETLAAVVTAAHRSGKLAIAHASQCQAYDAALLAGFDVVTAVPIDGQLDAVTVQGLADKGVAVVPTLCFLNQALQDGASSERAYDHAVVAVRQLYQAGVRICAGTVANHQRGISIPFGTSLHDELELLSRAGLSNLDVLRAATCVPAKVFRLHDRGVVEPGMRADLVLVQGNPLSDLTATRRIRQAWIEGVKVDVEAMLETERKGEAHVQRDDRGANFGA